MSPAWGLRGHLPPAELHCFPVSSLPHAASADPSETDELYDAFLSHSSTDRPAVRRIQRFLEAYSFGSPRRALRVFRDYSDLPSGELNHQFEEALAQSRFLLVASSPAAAESKWVDHEIRTFETIHRDPTRICVVVVKGSVGQEILGPLKQRDYLRHDLTGGWFLGIPRLRTRIELLRILATLTGQSMRTLARWHFWRTLRNWSLWCLATFIILLPVIIYALQSVRIWNRIDVVGDRGRSVFPVYAEVEGGAIELAYRFRGQGPQGFRNYFFQTGDALGKPIQGSFSKGFNSHTRLLPESLLPPLTGLKLPPSSSYRNITNRNPATWAFLGRPLPDVSIVVQPMTLTEEEQSQAKDDEVEFGYPVPPSKSSVIVTQSGGQTHLCLVEDLNPYWAERDGNGNPSSPSKGLAIVVDPDLGMWLGVSGWDARSSGGLWHSGDGGRTWNRVDGFESVTSLGIRSEGDRKCIVVAESHFDRWIGMLLEPYPSRVVISGNNLQTWNIADAPPYGSRSEIEFAGTLSPGQEVFRIDGSLYRSAMVPRWKSLLRGEIGRRQ